MATQNRNAQSLGWFPTYTGMTTSAVNAAATWLAFSFVPDGARQLSSIRAYVSAVTGTLGGSDITCDLYDSGGSNGAPGSAIESGKVPTATINAAGFYDFNGFSAVLLPNQEYWAVFKNVNGDLASNFATFRMNSNGHPVTFGTNVNRQGWFKATTTNSGVAWSTGGPVAGIRVDYSDGTCDGYALANATTAGSGDGVYSTREAGVKFTSPAVGLLVAGIAMQVTSKTGSPTGSPRFGMWVGEAPVNLGYTRNLRTTTITATQWATSYFANSILVPASSVLRVTLGESTQSDAVTDRWNMFEHTWDTDANSLGILPFDGTLQKTYYDGSAWSDTAGRLYGFGLLLDSSSTGGTGFVSSGSGGGRGGRYPRFRR